MKVVFGTIALFFFINFCRGQEVKFDELKVGDTIPEMVLDGFINSESQLKLSDLYNGKGLIINFWATWCVPCLKEMPLLDSLVKANPSKLNVLSVTYESTEVVKRFIEKRRGEELSNLMILPKDTLLSNYFPHRILPHNVWIDSRGVIKGITGVEGVNQNNVEALFLGNNIESSSKSDLVEFDMFETFHQMDSNFMYRSILTGYVNGLPSGTVYRKFHPTKRKIIRYFTFNNTLASLLWSAINLGVSFKDYYNIMEIHTNDSTRFFVPRECPESFSKLGYQSMEEWREKNLYCYEIKLPTAIQDTTFFGYILNDLLRTFNLSVSVEERKIPCSIIEYRKGKTELVSNTSDTSFVRISKNQIIAKNVSIIQLFQQINEKVKPDLNSKPHDPPFIDNTGIRHNIDIELDFDDGLPDYPTIKSMLKEQFGLEIIYKRHKYPITIVKDLEP